MPLVSCRILPRNFSFAKVSFPEELPSPCFLLTASLIPRRNPSITQLGMNGAKKGKKDIIHTRNKN
jgi:hypothetical protein